MQHGDFHLGTSVTGGKNAIAGPARGAWFWPGKRLKIRAIVRQLTTLSEVKDSPR